MFGLVDQAQRTQFIQCQKEKKNVYAFLLQDLNIWEINKGLQSYSLI